VGDTLREAGRRPIVELVAPDPGTRTLAEPVTAVVMIDQSGSTVDSDPENARVTEAETWARWVGEHSGNPADEIAAVHFTSAVEASIGPLKPSENPETSAEQLFDSGTLMGGGTKMVPALEVAKAIFDDAPADNRRLLVMFTDGAAADLNQTESALRAVGADSVWLVALNIDGTYEESAAKTWEHFGLTGALRMDRLEAGAVASSLAEIFMGETGQTSAQGVLRVR
jgi:Mg-chelatase subunit ChlD